METLTGWQAKVGKKVLGGGKANLKVDGCAEGEEGGVD